MLTVVIGRQAAKVGAVGIQDADLILRLHFENLADKNDLARWLAIGLGLEG